MWASVRPRSCTYSVTPVRLWLACTNARRPSSTETLRWGRLRTVPVSMTPSTLNVPGFDPHMNFTHDPSVISLAFLKKLNQDLRKTLGIPENRNIISNRIAGELPLTRTGEVCQLTSSQQNSLHSSCLQTWRGTCVVSYEEFVYVMCNIDLLGQQKKLLGFLHCSFLLLLLCFLFCFLCQLLLLFPLLLLVPLFASRPPPFSLSPSFTPSRVTACNGCYTFKFLTT